MQYRKDIDGLRALAVVPVILFHAGFSLFSGGFVGVDVFFVISGFLITKIIIAELELGRFSVVKFYERRARRILPALFFVVFFCLPFAFLFLTPSEIEEFFKSIIGVSLFISNVFFWRESDYFSTASELKPLLHTWSLSVEEQFYIIFPLALFFLFKCGKKYLIWFLMVGALLSFFVAQWGVLNKPTAAFFLLPTRAWELLIGSIAAVVISYDFVVKVKRKYAEAMTLLGLIFIVVPIFTYSSKTPFPGVYAILPCIGAFFIIIFGQKSLFFIRILDNRIFVKIGLISYSAYLIHQPVLAFVRHSTINNPNVYILIVSCIFVLIASYLSWRFIEQPFRDSSRFKQKFIFSSSGIGLFLLLLIGILGFKYYKIIYDDNMLHFDNSAVVNTGLHSDCDASFSVSDFCRTSSRPNAVIWGDSYAMHLLQGILASDPEISLVQKTLSSCTPIKNSSDITVDKPVGAAEKCKDHNTKTFNYIVSDDDIKYVVVSSPFERVVNSNLSWINDNGLHHQSYNDAKKDFINTVKELEDNGKKVIIFSPPPKNGSDIGFCLRKSKLFSRDLSECNFLVSSYKDYQSKVIDFLKEVDENHQVVWLSDFLCGESYCKTYIEEVPIYRDNGHLSLVGSAFLGKSMNFKKIIENNETSN